ncbi:MAG: tail fiber domain-containing protein [Lachnospiraceae bacterium]|nr:tail fiber domain-containing protein [Lachnospiraceae bacterium]
MAWFDSKHTDGRCLPLEGGTVKGEVRLKKGSIVHEIPYGSPVDGYFHVCRIKVIDNYCDSPVCIDYILRDTHPVKVIICFNGRENIGDETIKYFYYETAHEDGISVGAYLHNQAPGIWDLYVKKHASFGRMAVTGISYDYGYARFNIEWCSGFYTTLPEPCTKAVPYTPKIRALYMDGGIVASHETSTHLKGAVDGAIINSTAPSGGYAMLCKLNSINGVFNIGVYNGSLVAYYISREKIDLGKNDFDVVKVIMNESGDSIVHGRQSADAFQVGVGTGCNVYPENVGSGYYDLKLGSGYNGSTQRTAIVGASSLHPGGDNLMSLGTGNLRWKQVYAVNGAISTSDRNLKEEISYIGSDSQYKDTYMSDAQLVKFMLGLLPCIFKRTDGESGRPHHGIIAQDFEKLLKDIGLHDHAAFIKSPKMVRIEDEIEKEVPKEILQEDGTVKTVTEKVKEKIVRQEVVPNEYIYGIRYEELEGDTIRFCQIIYNRLETLEDTAKGQQEQITDMEDTLKTQEEKTNNLEERLKKFEEMFKTCADKKTEESEPGVMLY